MRYYSIHHLDSFTKEIFGGNPTVTVLEADTLSTDEMKKIAIEMQLSETGFVLKSSNADFRLRYFTKGGNEVKFCGHATVGALYVIALKKLYNSQPGRLVDFKVETNAGILKMGIDYRSEQPKIFFDAPSIVLKPSNHSAEDLIEAMKLPKELFDLSRPVMIEKTNNYLYLTAKSLNHLKEINPDFTCLKQFCEKDGIVVVSVLTNETFSKDYHLHCRGFAPLVGVPEDPFTGSMQGGLAAYAHQQQLISKDLKWIGVEQGHFMNRPGFVQLEVCQREPYSIRLHADAVHLYESQLTLP